MAILDVQRAKLFGPCEPQSGITLFDRLGAQVMAADPYAEARRVFRIVDNGSAHHRTEAAGAVSGALSPAGADAPSPRAALWSGVVS